MLQNIRDKLTGWIAGFILALIAIAFVFWGIDFGFFSRDYIARVNGEEIPTARFRNAYQSRLSEMQRYYRDDLPLELREEIRQNTLEAFIRNTVLEQRVRKAGYRVGDEAVVGYIHSLPVFQVGGSFSRDAYRAQLAASNISPARFEAEQRRAMELEQLRLGIVTTGFATPGEARRFIELQEERREVAFARLAAEDFVADAKVDEEAISAYYESNRDAYRTPESVTLQYVEVTAEDVADQVEVTEEGLRDYYEGVKGRYTTPERRHPRHILVEFGDDEAAAEARAAELTERARAGEDFAELAREYSQDSGTAELGGDLDWIERGVFEGALEDAIFAMDVGEIRGPVRSEFGYHVLLLDELEPESVRSFDEVRAEIEGEYRREQSEGRYYERAEQLAELAFEDPDELDGVAAALGTEVRVIKDFSRAGGGELAGFPQVVEAVFSPAVLEDGENSRPIELSESRAVVLRVADHRLPQQRPLEDVREEVVAALKLDAARERAIEQGEALLRAAQDGASLAEAAAANGAEYHEPTLVGRRDPGLAPQLLGEIFRAPKPAAQSTLAGLALSDGDYVVYAISAVEPGKVEASSERLNERRQLSQQVGALDFSGYVSDLQRGAKVKVFEFEEPEL
jgi:peptidyl-prolyl cis-trans isomerase D